MRRRGLLIIPVVRNLFRNLDYKKSDNYNYRFFNWDDH